MKSLIRRCMIAMCAGFLLMAGAQLRPAEAESAMILGDILKKTESYYQQVQAFTASFSQSTTSSAASAMTTEASGKLYYQKPRQMRWEYDKPERQLFIANQQLAWLYVPSENQISLFDAKNFFASPLARTFFDGVAELRKNFEVILDHKQSTSISAVLKLTPKEEDPNIRSLLLWVDMHNYHILSIETHDALGNTNRIVLESQQGMSHLDPKLFQLEIPPSTHVVDMEGRDLSPPEIDKLKQKLLPKQEK